MDVSGQLNAPATLSPGKDPRYQCIGSRDGLDKVVSNIKFPVSAENQAPAVHPLASH